jgi:hypothetical protein
MRQHTSAYVSIRSAYVSTAYVSIRQHTSAYVSIRQHSIRSAYVEAHLLTVSVNVSFLFSCACQRRDYPRHTHSAVQHTSAYASIRLHTSRLPPPHSLCGIAYVSVRQHTTAYVSIRQHAPAYVNNTSAYVSIRRDCPRHTHSAV